MAAVDSSLPDEDVVMRKRETRAVNTVNAAKVEEPEKPDTDHEAIVSELISNPQKLRDVMRQMNMDADQMKHVMRDITSNPEAMKGAREMMGVSTNEELRDKLMKKMSKNGKQPSRKQVMKQQKEMKKVLRGRTAEEAALSASQTPLFIHIDASKKLKLVNEIPRTQYTLGEPDTKQFGHLIVYYNVSSKNHNRLAKRIFKEPLGALVTFRRVDNEPIEPNEAHVTQLAHTPYVPRLFDGTVDEEEFAELFCKNEVCCYHENEGCTGASRGECEIVSINEIDDEVKEVHTKNESSVE